MAGNTKESVKKSRLRANPVIAVSVTVILVSAAILIFLYRDLFTGENLKNLFAADRISEKQEQAFTYETGSDQVFASAGDGLAVASATGMQLFDSKGDSVVHEIFSMDVPAVATSKLHCAFYDIGGTVLRLAGFDGSYTDMDTENNIVSVNMNENGWMAVVTEESGYKGAVTVYNADLAPVYEWQSGSGYIISAQVSPDNKRMAVLSADSSGGKVTSFSFDSEKEKGSISLTGELFFDLRYMSEDRICAISEDRAVFLDGSCKEKGSYDFGDLYLTEYDLGGDGFVSLLLSVYRSGNSAYLINLDSSGDTLGKAEIQRDLLSMSAGSKGLLVLYSDGMVLYSQELSERGETEDILGVKQAILRQKGDVLKLSSYSAEIYRY
jgi:hypothetical protein